ncbi:putative autotransporter protein [Fimbriiglobus ruber]|uniref:Putative autotransporter protein n=1 Tax=Fimbriiglobus ruber TaxID=1908690 RepID=A0A225DGF6_9BACT|nr:putative autotransporter protein [Fimbriiglobus ruber]
MPSTVTFASNILTYTAGSGVSNNVSVTLSGSNYVITDSAETISFDPSAFPNSTGSGSNTVDIATTDASGITGVTLNLVDGSDTVTNVGLTAENLTINNTGTLTLGTGQIQTTTGNIAINNSGTLLTLGGPILTTTGNISVNGSQQVTLTDAAQIGGTVTSTGTAPTAAYTYSNQTTGTISINANQGGSGSSGFNQAGGWLITSNNTANAVAISVNTAGGGTGNATIGLAKVGTAIGSYYTVNANGGSILWSNDPAVTGPWTGSPPAPPPQTSAMQGTANGGSDTSDIYAYNYVFTTSGAASAIGTSTATIQTFEESSSGTTTLTAGSGGAYQVDWGSPLILDGATATGAGNIRVVTANAGGHNLTVAGPVNTGSGSIYLAADDDLYIQGAVGSSTFSGTVSLFANRDVGNTSTLNFNANGSITTTNTSSTAVTLTGYSENGTAAGSMTVGNITTGNGGTITLTTVPATSSSGGVISGFTSGVVLNAGATGTVTIKTRPYVTSIASAVGTATAPLNVVAGTVNISALSYDSPTTASPLTYAPNTPAIYVSTPGNSSGNTNFNVNIAVGPPPTPPVTPTPPPFAAIPIVLTTTAGTLTVSAASGNLNNGTMTLNGAAGVILNAALGNTTTGAITINGPLSGSANIVNNAAAVTVSQSSDSSYSGLISGATNFTKSGPGNLSLTNTAAQTYTGTTTVSAGTLTPTGNISSTGAVTVAAGATLANSGTATTIGGAVTDNGTLSPGGPRPSARWGPVNSHLRRPAPSPPTSTAPRRAPATTR